MEYVFRTILNLITTGMAACADMLGTGVLTLLRLNIGEEGSFFDMVFNSIGDFALVFQIMGLSILAINFVWQLIKMMVMQQGGNETPFQLVMTTFISGVFVIAGKPLIMVFQQFFAAFYNYILNVQIDGANVSILPNFNGMVGNLTNAVGGGTADATVGLGGLIITLLLTLLIIYQFIMFLIEIVERYVVLGMLIYTSPLAFSMAGSKSTSNVFGSWVRMMGSQMFLMVCNVLFFRLFLVGFMRYDETVASGLTNTAGEPYSELSLAIVWCLVLYGILVIGSKIDSYLGTLGLSAAQTGRGLAASLVATGLGVQRALSMGGNLARGAAGSKAGKYIGGKASEAASRFKHDHMGAGEKVKRDPQTGAVSGQSLINKAKSESSKREDAFYNGHKAGVGFTMAAQGLSQSTLDKLDTNSFRMGEDGRMSMKYRGADGKEATVTAVPLEGPNKSRIDPSAAQGRIISITGENGQTMKMFATAQGAAAAEFLAANPQMDGKMKEFFAQEGCSAKQVAPGVWQTERRDSSGNVVEAKEYAAASLYRADAALGSHVEEVGGMQYHVSDITSATQRPYQMQQPPASGMQPHEAVQSVQSQFHDLNALELSQVQPDFKHDAGGTFTYTDVQSGVTYAAAPAATYAVAESLSGTAQTMVAANGAQYVSVPVQDYNAAGQAFTRRVDVVPVDAPPEVTPTAPGAQETHQGASGPVESGVFGTFAQPRMVVDDVGAYAPPQKSTIYMGAEEQAQRHQAQQRPRGRRPRDDGKKKG